MRLPPCLRRLTILAVLTAAVASPLAMAAKPALRVTATRPPPAPAPQALLAEHPGLTALADGLAQEFGLDAGWTREQLAQARRLPQILPLVLPAPNSTPKNWAAYRARFIEPVRLRAGLRFWQRHRDDLLRAQAEFGVPADLIVGVLGVETLYGQHMGRFRVLDSLTTLALEFPSAHPRAAARQAFFRSELGHLLQLAQRQGIAPASLLGSYAGAMGWPQFMPSSWLRHAVDFDRDGRIDLAQSPVDAIGSVANYFKAHGWQTGLPTHLPVQLSAGSEALQTLLQPDIVPSFSPSEFEGLGARLNGPVPAGKLALIALENGLAPRSYLAGTQNFYVVTRYNWSSYYAMAVIELGAAVKAMVPD